MSKKKQVIPGIHVQWPWSQYLVDGRKTIETRHYPLPKKHQGKTLAIIETPGPKGKKEAGIDKARIIGTITFGECFAYPSKKVWAADSKKHLVAPDDTQYGYAADKTKWAWPIAEVKKFDVYQDAPKTRGIIFATACDVVL